MTHYLPALTWFIGFLLLIGAGVIAGLYLGSRTPGRGYGYGYGRRYRTPLQRYRYRVHRHIRRIERRIVDAVALSGIVALVILIAPHIH